MILQWHGIQPQQNHRYTASIHMLIFIHFRLNVLLFTPVIESPPWWFLYLSFHVKNSKNHFILFNTIYLSCELWVKYRWNRVRYEITIFRSYEYKEDICTRISESIIILSIDNVMIGLIEIWIGFDLIYDYYIF